MYFLLNKPHNNQAVITFPSYQEAEYNNEKLDDKSEKDDNAIISIFEQHKKYVHDSVWPYALWKHAS